MAAAARSPSETILNISGIRELDSIYSLLAPSLKEIVESINTGRAHRFSHMIPILLGGYALYKYYPQELLNNRFLRTEDIDFKFILNSNDEAEYATFKDTLTRGLEKNGVVVTPNNIYHFFENNPSYKIDIKFDYNRPPLYFNYESKFLDVSIIKEYNSLNLFLEFDQLFPDSNSRSISNIPFELLKPSVLSENDDTHYFFGTEEFLDFNTIHLYIFIDTLIRSRIVNPRLIKTSKIMSRLMILLSKGYNSGRPLSDHTLSEYTLFNSLESLLLEFNTFYTQFPEQSQPSVILETLSSLINRFSPIITAIESNIEQNPAILTVCNFLMSKLQDLNIPGLPQPQPQPQPAHVDLSHNEQYFFQEPYQYPEYQEGYNPELFYYHLPPPYHHFQPPMGAEGTTQGRNKGKGSRRGKGKGRGGPNGGGGSTIDINYLINLLGKDLVHLDLDKVDEKEKLKRYCEAWLFIEFNNKLFELIKKMNVKINKNPITIKSSLNKTKLELRVRNNRLVKVSGGSKRKNVKSKKLRKTITKRNINRNIKKTTNHKKTKKHNRRKISIKKQKGGYEIRVEIENGEKILKNNYKIMKSEDGFYFILPINPDSYKDFYIINIDENIHRNTDENTYYTKSYYKINTFDEIYDNILNNKENQIKLKSVFENPEIQNIAKIINDVYNIYNDQDEGLSHVVNRVEHSRPLVRPSEKYNRGKILRALSAQREHEHKMKESKGVVVANNVTP